MYLLMRMIKIYKNAIPLLILFFIVPKCFAQNFTDKVKYQLETGGYFSTSGQTPFELRSNQYGIIPLSAQFLTLRGVAHKDYDSIINIENKLNKFSYGYGINTIVNIGKVNQIILPEAYLKVRYGVFEIYGGRRKEVVGLVDTLLTSGSYIWSGNALPVPKMQISIPNYTSIVGHGLVSIKGAFAHGWFDNGIVLNSYLHQKWFYGRIGKPNWKIKLYAGFNHQVQWGGYPIKSYTDAQSGKLITNFGNDFKTYLNAVTGISLNKNGRGIDLNGVPLNEAWNRAGNHLGSVDISTEFNFKNYDLLIYRQSVYDDGSLFYLNNITDGLFGISFKRKNISNGIFKLNFEYLNTTSQGGAAGSGNTIPQLRGQDNYFTNSIYLDGWTYKKNVIGTPFIVPFEAIDLELTKKYDLKSLPNTFIMNSRIKMWHIALQGKFLNIHYLSKIALSKNYGSYNFDPFYVKQFSFLQHISYSLRNYQIISSVSIDRGKLYPNNLGCYLGIRRTFP